MKYSSRIITIICILVTIAIVHHKTKSEDIQVVKKNLSHLLGSIYGYRGDDLSMDQKVVDELDADVFVFRNYQG